MIRALILDLDNTIYPVHSISDALFPDLFKLIEESGEVSDRMDDVKKEVMRRPFQHIAKDMGFSEELTNKGIDHLKNLEYKGPIAPFPEYRLIANHHIQKFLVTTGFLKLQNSKIDGMGLRSQFEEIHVVDPMTSSKTKKDVFADILKRFGFSKEEVMVVGDDPNSEIKAGLELGLNVIRYEYNSGLRVPDPELNTEFGIRDPELKVISNFRELLPLIS